MKFEKIHLDDMVRCYSASHMNVDGKLNVLLASENPESECYSYSGENFENKEVVWQDRGGCMSIIPIPNRENEFLAVNEFYLKVSPSLSKLVWGKHTEDGWQVRDVQALPYLHRFDIYDVNGENYVIAATIARAKDHKEDWTRPGQIYIAKMPDDLSQGLEFEEIATDMFRNHGYSRDYENGKVVGYFGSDQGILKITPPHDGSGVWKKELILEGTISEIALSDLDNDGVKEIMTIEPFHGNVINIYKQDSEGKYQKVYTYPNEIDFAHSLVGTHLAGQNCFVAGIRRVDAELMVMTYENGEYKPTIVEKGVGPANLDVVHRENDDVIISANHTKAEAAVYKVTK